MHMSVIGSGSVFDAVGSIANLFQGKRNLVLD